ncbi:MAG: hypothetical protein PHF97_09875 [Bacteroidales bacterium]|nr:hypothetical protein [Bacteroidales bacterium]
MIIKDSSFTIVLAGSWNQVLLTPEWVKKHLFQDEADIKVEFSTNLAVVLRYRIKNIYLSVDNMRVILFSADNSDASLELMESTAIKLCNILLHTPLRAVGINFGFVQKENKDKLFELFRFEDDENIRETGWQIKKPIITRTLEKEGVILNLKTFIDDNNDINFEFNYHTGIESCSDVETVIKNKVVSLKTSSLEFLRLAHSLNLE